MLKFRAAVVAVILAVSTVAWAQEDAPQEPPKGPPPAMVSVEKAAPVDAMISFEYVGQVAGAREVEVRARVSGIIEERLYEEGTKVEKDAVLFRIDPAPYKAALDLAKAHVAQAEARLKQTSRDYARIKPLAKSEAASKKERDDAEAAVDLAKAALQAAKAERDAAQINFDYTAVTAPISGVTGRAMKVEGSLATPQDSLLTTMAQVDPVYIDFSIPVDAQAGLQRDIAAGHVVMPESGFVVRLKNASGVDLPETGKINFKDYKADQKTGSFAARALVANPDGALAPGQFVRVVLSGAKRPNVYTVPQRAVLDGAQGKFVYVAQENEQGMTVAMARPVDVGAWVDGAMWIIKSGLKPGDQVIVDGMARIFFPGVPVMIADPNASPPQMPPGMGGH
ncbi:MAG: efflux RND transporter periplasmic adaptor subunit [Alphaproteobacteria bacterium]|nr:efflux RND transporter periplasmic adaptor subunit [Alphaproteobacteria bacterium]